MLLKIKQSLPVAAIAATATLIALPVSAAMDVAEHYKDKTVTILIGYGPPLRQPYSR